MFVDLSTHYIALQYNSLNTSHVFFTLKTIHMVLLTEQNLLRVSLYFYPQNILTASSSESDDSLDFPLIELTSLRNQVELKRNASSSFSDGRSFNDITLEAEDHIKETNNVDAEEERDKRTSSLKAAVALKEMFEGLTEDFLEAFDDDDIIDPDFTMNMEADSSVGSADNMLHIDEVMVEARDEIVDRGDKNTDIPDSPLQPSGSLDGSSSQSGGQMRKRKSLQEKREEK